MVLPIIIVAFVFPINIPPHYKQVLPTCNKEMVMDRAMNNIHYISSKLLHIALEYNHVIRTNSKTRIESYLSIQDA
jgi:hypothetical protein